MWKGGRARSIRRALSESDKKSVRNPCCSSLSMSWKRADHPAACSRSGWRRARPADLHICHVYTPRVGLRASSSVESRFHPCQSCICSSFQDSAGQIFNEPFSKTWKKQVEKVFFLTARLRQIFFPLKLKEKLLFSHNYSILHLGFSSKASLYPHLSFFIYLVRI